MTKQNKVHAARTEKEPYVITQTQKDAARERYNEQRAKRPKKAKEDKKKTVAAPVVAKKKK